MWVKAIEKWCSVQHQCDNSSNNTFSELNTSADHNSKDRVGKLVGWSSSLLETVCDLLALAFVGHGEELSNASKDARELNPELDRELDSEDQTDTHSLE